MGFNDERKAFLSAVVLATSAFFAGMGKTVFTDMIFTVFILCAFAMFMLAFKDRRRQGVGIIGFYVCCALATLTKTPLGFVIPQLAVVLFLLYARQMIFLRSRWVPVGILLYLLIALPWYLKMYQLYGQSFVGEYFVNDHWRRWLEAEHHSNDHWFFYPVTMIAGLFPWSLFLAASWVDLFKRLKSSVTVIDYLSLSWILAVLIVFQMAHSKLASYILPLYPALALMTGNFLGNCLRELSYRRSIQRLMMASFIILFLMGIAPMALHKLVGHYLSSSLPVYFLSASLIALGGIGITLAIKERFQLAVYVLALTLFPIFLTAFMIRNDVEGFASSHEACEYIPARSMGVMKVLTSKANARGIRFFTGQEIAVVDFGGKQFFSPHPVPILDTADGIDQVIEHQPVTYAVVRKAVYKFLLQNESKRYHVHLLKIIGIDYVLRIAPNEK